MNYLMKRKWLTFVIIFVSIFIQGINLRADIIQNFTNNIGFPTSPGMAQTKVTATDTQIVYTLYSAYINSLSNSLILNKQSNLYGNPSIAFSLDSDCSKIILRSSADCPRGSSIQFYADNSAIGGPVGLKQSTDYYFEIPQAYQKAGTTYRFESTVLGFDVQIQSMTYVTDNENQGGGNQGGDIPEPTQTSKITFIPSGAYTEEGEGTTYPIKGLINEAPGICDLTIGTVTGTSGFSLEDSKTHLSIVSKEGKGNLTFTPSKENNITLTKITLYGSPGVGSPKPKIIPANGSDLYKYDSAAKTVGIWSGETKEPLVVNFENAIILDYIEVEYKSWQILVESSDPDCSVIRDGDVVTLAAGSTITVTCPSADYMRRDIGNTQETFKGTSFSFDGNFDKAPITITAYSEDKQVNSLSFTLTIPSGGSEMPDVPSYPSLGNKTENKDEVRLTVEHGMYLYYKVYLSDTSVKSSVRQAAADDQHAGYTLSEEGNGHVSYIITNADNTDTHVFSTSALLKTADPTLTSIDNLDNRQLVIEAYAYNPKTENKSNVVVYAVKSDGTATGISGVDMDYEWAEPVYFNLQGQRVSEPQGGVFIRVQGGKVEKVVK